MGRFRVDLPNRADTEKVSGIRYPVPLLFVPQGDSRCSIMSKGHSIDLYLETSKLEHELCAALKVRHESQGRTLTLAGHDPATDYY